MVAEQVFEVQGESAQSLLWEEHGFRMYIPQDALLPNENCLVSVKAIVAGLFQFPEGTERVSAVYAISSSLQFHKPVMTELQHCVQLDSSEQGKYMSFAVAQHDPSSTHYRFQPLAGGAFQINSCFGIIERDHFCYWTIIKSYILGYTDHTDSGSEKSAGDELNELEDTEAMKEPVANDTSTPQSLQPLKGIFIGASLASTQYLYSLASYHSTLFVTKCSLEDSDHVKTAEVPSNIYNFMTFYEKQDLPYNWIVAVSQKYNTMEEV